jgi:hypothetical protein
MITEERNQIDSMSDDRRNCRESLNRAGVKKIDGEGTSIPLLLFSQVTRIIEMSHWHLVWVFFLIAFKSNLQVSCSKTLLYNFWAGHN